MLKINKSIIEQKIYDKMYDTAVTALVTEAFIGSLPFNKEDIIKNQNILINYSKAVMESLHPQELLKKALESTSDSEKEAMLQDLSDASEEFAKAAASKMIKESSCEESDDTLPEIMDTVKADEQAVSKLTSAGKNMDIENMSKLIKQSVVEALKDDKASYEEEQKIRDDIKNMISDDPKNNETSSQSANKENDAIESYLDIILKPTDARHPISLFSKIQDMCFESLMAYPLIDEELHLPTLKRVTMESTFDYFDKNTQSLESIVEDLHLALEGYHEECDKEEKLKKISKTAFICSICILTMLQTLKSMNLIRPNATEISDIISKKHGNINIPEILLRVQPKLSDLAEKNNREIAMGAMTAAEAINRHEKLDSIKESFISIESVMIDDTEKQKIIGNISSMMRAIESTLEGKEKEPNIGLECTSAMETNTIQIQSAVRKLMRNPLVNHIQIEVKSSEKVESPGTAYIEVFGMDVSDKKVISHTITLQVLPKIGETIAEILIEAAKYADFNGNTVYIYYTDTCYKVNIKK